MFKIKLYILLFLATSIKCVVLKQLSNCKIGFSFINNHFCNEKPLYNKNLFNDYKDEEHQQNCTINKYTLDKNFVLYARKAKTEKKQPKSVKKVTRKTRKKVESPPESEPIQEPELAINKELENESDLNLDMDLNQEDSDMKYEYQDENESKSKEENKESKENNEGDTELSLSKRMISSVLSLTSSLYTPDFYDIIPILYNIRDDILNITDNMGDQFKQSSKVLDKRNKITGLFLDNDEGRIDRLLLSIPSSILDRLSQSKKYRANVESTDSPLQLISLGPGFFSKVYQISVFPYLSEISRKAFNSELDHSNGLMEYIVSAPTDNKNYQEHEFREMKPVEREEFETVFKEFKIYQNQNFDLSLFRESTLKSLSVLIKCVKDFVYFNSCLLLLEEILGRKPTDKEILYSFQLDPFSVDKNKSNINNTKNKNTSNIQYQKHVDLNHHNEMRNKLVDIINYSETEIEYRIDRFFTPFLEVVIDRFENRVAKRSFYLKILVSCLKDSLQGMRARLYQVYPNVIMRLENNFIGQLFKIAYHSVRISAIKQNLPMHLPLSTLRLAKRALLAYKRLQYLQYNIILKYRNKLIDLKSISSTDSIGKDEGLGKNKNKDGKRGKEKGNETEKGKGRDTGREKESNEDVYEYEEFGVDDFDFVDEFEYEDLDDDFDGEDSENQSSQNKDKNKNKLDSKSKIESKNNKSKKDKDKIDVDDKAYREFITEIVKIEKKFKNRSGDRESNEFMRKQQQEKLLDEMVAKVLNVSVDRVTEAIDAYNMKEVGPRDKMPKHLRMRLSHTNLLHGSSGYYMDLNPMEIYDEKDDLDLVREKVYRKTLRKLAIEAIDDRLTRLLYMSHNNLFLELHPEYEEVIEKLGIAKKTADFIVFTATLICREYEVWRIKLNLPPYVNEFNVNPAILKNTNLDPFDLPYHISTAVYNDIKRNVSSTMMDDETIPTVAKGPKKNKRDVNNRSRHIKPNMSSVNDMLMNYKQNYKEYERILQKSPMEYLKPTGVYG